VNVHVQARLTLVLSSVVAAGCGIIGPTGPHADDQIRLTMARNQWRAQSLADYSYVFSRGCFCTLEAREPVAVTVRGGAIVSVVSVAGGVPRDAAQYRTVEGLFAFVQDAIDRNAATIRAEYDPTRGYLTSAYFDMDEKIADEEFSIEAKTLTPLR
jgi:Family of unknown function (DUF6174)